LIVEAIARLRDSTPEAVGEATARNAQKLFRLEELA
jgi:Tat protein secretion system quality control protein TatD with DNase activity